jgi:hypothetical protein
MTTDAPILLQYVITQRGERPSGQRVLQDGTLQAVAADNPPPSATEPLDRDRVLVWETRSHLSAEQVAAIKATILATDLFDLPPKLLINYCKEDPGTGVWSADVDGRKARVVVYDPKPKRSAAVDSLMVAFNALAN